MSDQPLSYRDFDLRFSGYNAADGSFKVWVEGSMMRPDDAVTRTYLPADFWDDTNAFAGGLLGLVEGRRFLTREHLFQLGQRLYDLALPQGTVRDLFTQSRAALKEGEGLRLRLHIDPAPLK